jgi:uncharacterized repeat protein (TIGR01451 family)
MATPKPTARAISAFVRSCFLVLSVLALSAGLDAGQVAFARASAFYGLVKTYPDPSPSANEEFGNALALLPGGNQVVVAARSDTLSTGHALTPTAFGAVHVLTTTTGTISRTITDTAGAANDYFGYSLAVSGTHVLVGDTLKEAGATQNAGAAFLYDTDTGALLQSFSEPSPTANNKFGTSVAFISDTAVLVGVPYYDIGSDDSQQDVGRAYICQIADGTCSTVIDSPSIAGHSVFGLSVVALGDYFAIAAPLDGTHGHVYVYTTTSASLYRTITLSGVTSGDYFGSSLASVNGNLLVGAQNGGTGVANTPGAAYLFTPAGVLLHAFNNPNTTDSGALFGAAVAGDGNLILIGAPNTPNTIGSTFQQGRAFVFNATTGALIDTLQKPSPAAGDHFGNAVDMLGETFVVGAYNDSQFASGAGAVYRFGITPANLSTSSKSVSVTLVKPGELFTYTVKLANTGSLSATYALTDTLDPRLVLVSAPGLAGTSTLTASGVLTGGTVLSYTIAVHSIQPLVASIANVAHLSGDGSLRNLNAPNVQIGNRTVLPLVWR